jgi:hypothetical protein
MVMVSPETLKSLTLEKINMKTINNPSLANWLGAVDTLVMEKGFSKTGELRSSLQQAIDFIKDPADFGYMSPEDAFELRKANRKLRKTWIDIDNALPDDGQRVWVNCRIWGIFDGKFLAKDSFERTNIFITQQGAYFQIQEDQITHWMPLETPKRPNPSNTQ